MDETERTHLDELERKAHRLWMELDNISRELRSVTLEMQQMQIRDRKRRGRA